MNETVSLVKVSKGEQVNLNKDFKAPIEKLRVVLSWKKRLTDGPQLDLDISTFLLGTDGKLAITNGKKLPNFVFYGNLESPNKAIWRTEDERAGGMETVWAEMAKIGSEVQEIAFIITIDEFEERKQNFGQVKDAEIVFFNDMTGEKLAFIDLDEDHSAATAVHALSLSKRRDGTWVIKNVDEGTKQGLDFFVNQYGLGLKP